MRRASLLIATPLLVATLAGCAGSSTSDNAKGLTGDRKAVAQVIDDLSSAGGKRDGKEICTSVLSTQLESKLSSGNRDCASIVTDQLKDADSHSLDLVKNSISVTGDTATAKVSSPVDGNDRTQTLRFVRQSGHWRISGIG